MTELTLPPPARRRILHYAEQTASDESHWGDGHLAIPEEENLLDQCRRDAPLRLSSAQLRILWRWFLDATRDASLLSGEDLAVLRGLAAALGLPTDRAETDLVRLITQRLFPTSPPSGGFP